MQSQKETRRAVTGGLLAGSDRAAMQLITGGLLPASLSPKFHLQLRGAVAWVGLMMM